jgi:hypothetical protein
LVTKTSQLEKDVAAAKQAIEERDLRIRVLEEQNARTIAAAGVTPGLNPLAEAARAEAAENVARQLQQELASKQAWIDVLEGNLDDPTEVPEKRLTL